MRCRIINAAYFYQWGWRYVPITILPTRLFYTVIPISRNNNKKQSQRMAMHPVKLLRFF
jgi:hypothetical protein